MRILFFKIKTISRSQEAHQSKTKAWNLLHFMKNSIEIKFVGNVYIRFHSMQENKKSEN